MEQNRTVDKEMDKREGEREMAGGLRDPRWKTLRTIAETLNRSTAVRPMLQSVLEELLNVTGLSTGWIFLTEERPGFEPVAVHRLPPALSRDGGRPMCRGSCWCLNRYWDGRLKEAVNIIECKRLEDAVKYDWGDTGGITHHATVPLTAGEERIGLLNVASPGKERFSEEELALLEAVAYQIGTAVQKTRLIQAQKKRAELYARLDEASRAIWSVRGDNGLPERAVCEVGRLFGWPFVAMWVKEGKRFKLASLYFRGTCVSPETRFPLEKLGPVSAAFAEQRAVSGDRSLETIQAFWPDCAAVAAVPVSMRTERIGVLSVGVNRAGGIGEGDLPVLKALGEHLSLALESARLEEERQQLTVSAERNRLARDLHDSVNQKLFSLSLTARAAQDLPPGEIRESLEDIQNLSTEALKEMRSLIWQLRPPGLEKGVLTELRDYGRRLGLKVEDRVEGVRDLPRNVEEALWRIGQEALNNISRHAGTDQVLLVLKIGKDEVLLEVEDHGRGFSHDPDLNRKWSLGITSMKERAELLGGTFTVKSRPGEGTLCRTVLPLRERSAEHGDPDPARG
ncbi:GAF domain-containing sensor histidine kinase [Melghirimyces profundicolus]|nr:GAF domain-containing sensor histidine kinase [Melghirimyces profundicolus]